MARMVRKQLYLDEAQDRALAQRAEQLGVTQAELVRRAVDRFLAEERPSAREEALEALKEGWAESDRRGVGGGIGTWNREDLYER